MKIRRVDFSFDEWIAGTLGMTPEEEGIYIRIVSRIYSHGGPLPSDPSELAHLCGVRPQVMRRILPKLMPKFRETGGKLTSNRCETEMKLARNRLESARINGAKGGRPNDLGEPGGYVNGKPIINHQPSSSVIEDSVANATAVDPVKAMWERGRAVLGKSAGSLIGKARRDHGEEAVMAAILACEHEGPAEPVEFFLGCLRQKSRKRSAAEKFYAGAMEAADEFTRQQSRNGRADHPASHALLDSR